MTSTTSPSKFIMSDADLPFLDRVKLRENLLAWISRDIGLSKFFFPPNYTTSLTSTQKNHYVLSVIDNYLASSISEEPSVSPSDSKAPERCLRRENASHLRRCVLALRRGDVTHRDLARYAMLLENLWDDINMDLGDSDWAMCSLKFDTSQVSLRLVYLWLYMKQEFPPEEHSLPVRRAVYASLVNAFFKDKAPIDLVNYDKHSTNFKCLLLAWYEELTSGCQDLDEKLLHIAETNTMNRAADFIDTFLRVIQPDDDWMLRAQTLCNAWDEGQLSKRSGVRRIKQTAKEDTMAYATNEEVEAYFANDGVDEDEDEDENEDANETVGADGSTLHIVKTQRGRNDDEDYAPEDSETASDGEAAVDNEDDDRKEDGHRPSQRKRLRSSKSRTQGGQTQKGSRTTKARGRGRPPTSARRSSPRHIVKSEPEDEDSRPRRGRGRPPTSTQHRHFGTSRRGRGKVANYESEESYGEEGDEIQQEYDDDQGNDTLEDDIENRAPVRKKGRLANRRDAADYYAQRRRARY